MLRRVEVAEQSGFEREREGYFKSTTKFVYKTRKYNPFGACGSVNYFVSPIILSVIGSSDRRCYATSFFFFFLGCNEYLNLW